MPRDANPGVSNVSSYVLSNGRAAQLVSNETALAGHWLAVADLGGVRGQTEDKIYLAATVDVDVLRDHLPELFQFQTCMDWCEQSGRFLAEQREVLGAVTVASQPLEKPDREQRSKALLELIRSKGLQLLHVTEDSRQWCARVNLLRQLQRQLQRQPQQQLQQQLQQQQASERNSESDWPDVSEQGLLASMDVWLAPYLENVSRLDDLKRLDLQKMLSSLLSWPLPAQLDEWAPSRITVPSGNRIAVDYCQSPPVLAVKLQEMFGCTETPSVAQGQQKLMLHLLSPAGRPLQVTQDLVGFWNGAYEVVKKEMKGRYPKHPWPDDPLQALPTAKTKRHLRG